MKKKRKQNAGQALADLIYEAGMLKRTPRSGWLVAGVQKPESVADHSYRCAVLAFVIASLESADAEKAMAIALFHDLHEARTGDMHKMAKRYVDPYAAEGTVAEQQTAGLPHALKRTLRALRTEDREQKSRLAKIVRDADILECLIQAKEYYENGIRGVKPFFRNGEKMLATESAKTLWRACRERPSHLWWYEISGR
ncbi:MAG: HD domain-containing protein [Candidatus Omnitrophica bacterium]|nr:HD domain-containing protein [Candidatus Omnitrophota bacterium]